jgi:hypothetical protein
MGCLYLKVVKVGTCSMSLVQPESSIQRPLITLATDLKLNRSSTGARRVLHRCHVGPPTSSIASQPQATIGFGQVRFPPRNILERLLTNQSAMRECLIIGRSRQIL